MITVRFLRPLNTSDAVACHDAVVITTENPKISEVRLSTTKIN